MGGALGEEASVEGGGATGEEMTIGISLAGLGV